MEQDGPTKAIAARVREMRTKRGWSGADLSRELRAVGVQWERAMVAKLETGRRKSVSVTELLALAYVLNVAPVHLLVPPDGPGEPYEVTPKVAADRVSARAWVRGVTSINDDADPREFFAEVPREEFYAVQQAMRPRRADEPYGVNPEDD